MKFESISIAGFRSFRQAGRFDFSPGLTYVTGDNRLEPELGANGVGKSTLFEALHWCLFGKTSRNLRASEVANWQNSVRCEVAVRMDGKELRRTWNPNTLQLDGAPIDQAKVEEVLGLSEETFLYAIYHAQFCPHFVDRGPTAQLDVFSDVLDLQRWEEAADKAATLARADDEQLGKLRLHLASERGRLRELAQQIDEMQESESRWWRQTIREAKASWADRKQAQVKIEAAKVKLETINHEVSALRTQQQTASRLAADQRAQMTLLGKKLLKAGDPCPICYRLLDRHAFKDYERELGGRLTTGKAKEQAADKTWREAECALADAITRRDAQAYQVRDLSANLKVLVLGNCPYDTGSLLKRQQEQQAKLDELLADEAALLWSKTAYEFWVKAFREIRLALVNEALLQLELTTNTALDALGLPDWKIEYEVESENKSGKLSKGFGISVRSPYNDGTVPFLAWSGGESQRLRLAVALGLSDLIQDFRGISSNVEIFDEPTAWLSEEGIGDLLEVLARRASEKNICCLIADHKALGLAFFTRTCNIVKDASGSHIDAN